MTADVAHQSFDWPALLLPRQASCLNLSKLEPCVNKALFNLNVLKTQLVKKDKEKEKGPSLARPSFSEIHAEREKDERPDSKSSKAVTLKSLTGRVNSIKVSRGNSEYWVILKFSPLLRRCKQLHSSIAHTGRSSK